MIAGKYTGHDYPLGTIGNMPMAYEEKVTNEALHKCMRPTKVSEDLSACFSPHLFTEKWTTI